MPNYDQAELIEKFRRYFEAINQFQHPIMYCDGLCFGFSVIYAIAPKFLEVAVQIMMEWNGNASYLANELSIPGIEKITLRQLFEMFINLVLFYQVDDVASQYYSECQLSAFELSHRNFLLPGDEFEVSMKNKEDKCYIVQRIQKNARMVGCFTDNDLRKILPDIERTFRAVAGPVICLLHNCKHACTLRYTRSEGWYFYNPNYDARRAKKCTLDEAITEMSKTLGHSLVIEVATFDEHYSLCFPAYEAMFWARPDQLLQEYGSHMIAMYASHNTLSALIRLAMSDKAVRTSLTQALVLPDRDGWTLLYIITQYAVNSLFDLFNLAAHYVHVRIFLAKALAMQSNAGFTPLHAIAQYAVSFLLALFDLAAHYLLISTSLAQALVMQDKYGWTPLHVIALYAADSLCALFGLARNHVYVRTYLAQALVMPTNDGWTGLQMIVQYANGCLSALQELAAEHTHEFPLELRNKIAIATTCRREASHSAFQFGKEPTVTTSAAEQVGIAVSAL